MTTRLLLLVLVLLWPCRSMGQVQLPTEPAPAGNVTYTKPLSLFVSARLLPACEALTKGKLAEAESAFAVAVKQNPDDLAARYGLVQAAPAKRDAWLQQYRKAVQERPDAVNSFMLGLLALYKITAKGPTLNTEIAAYKKEWEKIARPNLERAYALSQQPLAGIVLTQSYEFMGGDSAKVYESLLKNIGGEGVYLAYVYARKNEWQGGEMPVPRLPVGSLRILALVVGGLWAKNSGQHGIFETKMENGQEVSHFVGWEPFTPEQNRARAFLDGWRKRLLAVADAKPSQQTSTTRTQ